VSNLDFAVLSSRQQIDDAWEKLRGNGLVDEVPQDPVTRLKRLLGRPSAATALIPDPRKSWDVLRALEAIQERCGKEEAVLDMGSVGCAIAPALHRLGYSNVHGIDLDPQVERMAHADQVDYRVGDMTATPYADASFCAITSISVMEHGFHPEPMLREVSRLLKPGGFFFFSTDFWPEKIDTSHIRLFGMSWDIFSADEIERFVSAAQDVGLEPPSAEYATTLRDGGAPAISYQGFEYTFLAGALVRSRGTM
jgi:2-polyprenyl-3-methyl-5-hydroxy-6-metoxy-1,4-benzoquinol methylase